MASAFLTIQPGTSHPAVQELRAALMAVGYQPSSTPTDPTVYDDELKNAVMAFQAKVGQPVDGVVSEQTWAALRANTGPSWVKIGLMVAALGGLYWWWTKRRKPNLEFSRQRRLNSYGDAVDTQLIEEPLLLVERGDCEGAARLLMKRRTYVAGNSTPKNAQIFKRVAQRVIASCGRDVEPLVREAIARQEEEGEMPSAWEKIERKMRRKRGQPESPYRPAPGTKSEDARSRMSRLFRHGQRLPVHSIRRGEKTLYPTIRGGRVVYVPKDKLARGPSKPKTEAQKEKQAEWMAILRDKRKAAKIAANELRRKAAHYRREDGRDVLLRNLDD
jgi:hypothetical protein